MQWDRAPRLRQHGMVSCTLPPPLQDDQVRKEGHPQPRRRIGTEGWSVCLLLEGFLVKFSVSIFTLGARKHFYTPPKRLELDLTCEPDLVKVTDPQVTTGNVWHFSSRSIPIRLLYSGVIITEHSRKSHGRCSCRNIFWNKSFLFHMKRIAYLKLADGYNRETPSKQQKSGRLLWVCFLQYTFRKTTFLPSRNKIGFWIT